MAKKSGLVLTEIIVVCLIIAILASVAIVIYQRTAEKADRLLCETREKLIYTAVKMSIYDTGVVPASLTQVWPQYKDKAVAQLREENKKSNFSFIRNWALVKVAEAREFPEYYGNDVAVITCPRDPTPPRLDASGKIVGGVSYTINPAFAGKSVSELRKNKHLDLIYESDSKGGAMVYRHKVGGKLTSNYITAEGKPGKRWGQHKKQ